MSEAVALWDRFVAGAIEDSRAIDDGVGALPLEALRTPEARARLSALAYQAYELASQSLLLGAEAVGRLALACERAMDLMAQGALLGELALPILSSSTYTLRQAFATLATPDRSGARTEGIPVEAARYELETLFPLPGQESALPGWAASGGEGASAGAPDVPLSALVRRPDDATSARQPTGPTGAAVRQPDSDAGDAADEAGIWEPTVGDDMVELFFEEAAERIEDLSVKLLDIEQRPNDPELLRDVFRDMHTLKGSSAMVGLAPMNRLAHAAEDLVGQVRERHRAVDGLVVDALLAALDGLRDIAAYAQNRQPIEFDLEPILARLRDPSVALEPEVAPDGPVGEDADAAAPVHSAAPARSAPVVARTIRVDFDKLDRLMNLVGELVLGRDGLRGAIHALTSVAGELPTDRRVLGQLADDIGRVERVLGEISQDLDHSTGRLDAVSGELRDQVMKLRMVPVGGAFRKHHRTVRDLAAALGKRARLELRGEDTELDKLLVEAMDEPLMHLVRNAIDHGLERPDERVAAGKPAEGVVELAAYRRGNQIIVRVADDGKGIDPDALRRRAHERELVSEDELATWDDRQVLEVIFRPGFSTAAQVSEVSGRGVGMDVVKQAIVHRLKGTIEIDSELGRGTAFTLRMPLTLAIIQVLLARASGEVLAIPLDAVVRTITCTADRIQLVGDREVIEARGRQIPLIRLSAVLALDADHYAFPHAFGDRLHVVLTQVGGDTYGLACDHLIGKKEIVIKSLGDLLRDVPCAAGATILGDRCALILDVAGVIERAIDGGAAALRPPAPGVRPGVRQPDMTAPHVLVVEDSDVIRESLHRLLVDAGFRCTVAPDGRAGLEAASRQLFDLVSTDVVMPHMDGYELTRALRARADYHDVPIVMVTSRGERIDRVRGFDAGVDEYITKPHDRQMFLRVVRKLLGERTAREHGVGHGGGPGAGTGTPGPPGAPEGGGR